MGGESPDRLPALAADLVRRHVAVIAAGGARRRRRGQGGDLHDPDRFHVGSDPVEAGLVASLNRPGGNITGVSLSSPTSAAKRMEMLHELVPKAWRDRRAVNPTDPSADPTARSGRRRPRRSGGKSMFSMPAPQRDSTPPSHPRQRTGWALLVAAGSFLHRAGAAHSSRWRRATRSRLSIPIAQFRRGRRADELWQQLYRCVSPSRHYAGRFSRARNPPTCRSMQPTKFELVINLKTAKALGLDIPPTLLALADEVIE